jgi:hypothetical protein
MKITVKSSHRFLSSMAAWKQSGGEIVSVEEATRRSAICAECPRNTGGTCAGCFARRAVMYLMGHGKMEAAIPYKENPHIDKLKSCQLCGCDLKMKTFLPLGVLNNEGIEYPKWCWQNGPGHEEHDPVSE